MFSLPTLLALLKRHPRLTGILLADVARWSVFGLGWMVAFPWCFVDAAKAAVFWGRYVRRAPHP